MLLKDYKFSDILDSDISQVGDVESIIEELKVKGIVNSSPSSKEESYDFGSQKIRLQTISSRLYLLGYLRNKISSKRIHKKVNKIQEAVYRFQKDANLKTDSYIGEETWYALDQLVSFESKFNYNQWFIDDNIRPEVTNAMHRSIQLRLWSLGLCSSKPRLNSKVLKKRSLYNFKRILTIFLIKEDNFTVDFNYKSLKLLFNQDTLTRAIKKQSKSNNDSFYLNLSEKFKKRDELLSQRFIENCVKIELWLLGYETIIDGKHSFNDKEGAELRSEISKFYQDYNDYSKEKADKLALKITPRLFIEIGEIIEVDIDNKLEDESEEVSKLLISNDEYETQNNLERAWAFIKNKGMRLWDGLKRVWKWFLKIGKKTASFFEKNVFRAFYRYISKSYKIITKGIKVVVESFKTYFRGLLIGEGVFFGFFKDMDIISYLPRDVNLEKTKRDIVKLKRHSKSFKLGCQIIGFFFHVFKNIAKGFIGWVKLLYSLIKSYKDIKLFYFELKTLVD